MRTPITLALAATGAVTAVASPSDQAVDAASRLADLKREVAQLKGQSDQWLTEERAAEIRAIVADVLADAETRASLQGTSTTAGYNGGFFLSSADGSTALKLNVLEQIRWSFNDNEISSSAGVGGGAALIGAPPPTGQFWGFENKRTRLTFSGNVVDPSWTYKIAYYLGYSNSSEDISAGQVADSFVAKDFGNGASLTAGQFKVPFTAEYAIDVGNLQFMDYSVVNNFFNTGYGQGLKLGYEGDTVGGSLSFVNGFRQANAVWGTPDMSSEWAVAGRMDVKLAGNWAQFDHAQSWRGDAFGAKVGGGVSWERSREEPGTDVLVFTVDTAVDFGGANVAAAYYFASTDNSGIPGFDDSNPWGLVLSGGVFVADGIELIARWEMATLSFDLGGMEDFSALTAGANWYLSRNTAKVGFEFGYAFDAISPVYEPFALSNNWLEDATANEGQWVLRTQLSFSF